MSDLTQILTAEDVELLRKNYSAAAMNAGATAAVAGPFPPGAKWADFVLDTFYQTPIMGTTERERVVIALLAGSPFDAKALKIHFYWGLCEGLSVQSIAEVLLLTGTYMGLSAYKQSLSLLGETLGKLKAQIAVSATDPTAISSGIIARVLSA